MHIKKLYEIKKPVISFEVFPPKQESSVETVTGVLSGMTKQKPGFISVTYGAGGHGNNSKTSKSLHI